MVCLSQNNHLSFLPQIGQKEILHELSMPSPSKTSSPQNCKKSMTELFEVMQQTIAVHLADIYEEEELFAISKKSHKKTIDSQMNL